MTVAAGEGEEASVLSSACERSRRRDVRSVSASASASVLARTSPNAPRPMILSTSKSSRCRRSCLMRATAARAARTHETRNVGHISLLEYRTSI